MHVFSLVKDALLAFFTAHEYPMLFVLILIEEAGLPLPLPGDTLIALAGTNAHRTFLSALTVIAIATAAVTVGSSILYFFMRKAGPRFTAGIMRILRLRPDRVERMQTWFRTRGTRAIVLGRLIPGLRIPTTVIAGLSGVPYRVFLPSTAFTAVIWATFFYLVGDVLRQAWAPLTVWIIDEPDQAIGLVILALTAVAAWFWLRRDNHGSRLQTRLQEWKRTGQKFLTLGPFLLFGIVSLPSGASFFHLSREVAESDTLAVDLHLLRALDTHTATLPLALATGASLPGSALVVAGIALLLTAWLFVRRHWRSIFLVVVSVGGSAIFTGVVKQFVARPRPAAFFRVPESGFSFPSGHTLSATCLALVIGVLLWRGPWSRTRKILGSVALAAVVTSVGLSRLVLGVHYPTDVLGSMLLGTAWVSLLVALQSAAPLFPHAFRRTQEQRMPETTPQGTRASI